MVLDFWVTLNRLYKIIVLIIVLFIIFSYFLSMILGISLFFFSSEGLKFGLESFNLLYLSTELEISITKGLYFIFLWLFFILCFFMAYKYRNNHLSKIRIRIFKNNSSFKNVFFNNNLLAMPIITSILLVITLALHFFQSQGGFPTGAFPELDPFSDFLLVSQAVLLEEIIFRILPLGSFLAAYFYTVSTRIKPDLSRIKRFKIILLSVLRPEEAKRLFGLPTIGDKGFLYGLTFTEWIMVVFSSSLFGIAHYFGGWGPGKISQAAISGGIFAIAYLYYGFQAPFLFHWFFNYYFSSFDMASTFFSENFNPISAFISFVNVFLGVFILILVIFLTLFSFFRINKLKKVEGVFISD